MRNKILLLIVVVLSCFALKVCLKKEVNIKKEEKPTSDVATNISVKLLNPQTQELTTMVLEDYIIGVVAAEMPASFSVEALKAQAVASRSYAMYKMKTNNKDYDLVTDTSNQAFITKEQMQAKWQTNFANYYEKIKAAVLATEGEILTYNDEVICAFYFAMSNGYTEDAALVFGEKEDYITSVASTWETNLKNFAVTTTLSRQEFCTKLGLKDENINITDIKYSPTGRVNTITINGISFAGTKVRTLLGLRSTDFQIVANDNEVTITTKGYGHGVGMSQYGANEMAKLGHSYTEILKYYYQDVNITNLSV